MSLTNKILIAMVAGVLVGGLLNFFADDWLWADRYLVDGLFYLLGGAFINALKMLVVPLVTFSLICGVAGLGDVALLGRVGIKAFLLYLLTTVAAISLALFMATLFEPGKSAAGQPIIDSIEFIAPQAPPLTDVLLNIVPGNPVAAFADGKMLQIIFFVILFAVAMLMSGEAGRSLATGAEKLNNVMMQVVELVMKVAPVGVFCLLAKTFSEQGLGLILPMLDYFLLVAGCLVLHLLGTLNLLVWLGAKISPRMFMRKMRSAQVFAFSTASSNATIPVTLRTVEQRLGVNNSVASFTVPFGATINMDGTAIMQGVATVFIANVYGIDLNFTQYLVIIGMAVLASIGTAGVPGVGLIMLAMVFNQVGLPVEGIGLIIGVDRLLDMMRTAVNITGDAAVTSVVAAGEQAIDRSVTNDPDAGQIVEIELPHGAGG
ncbi:MAG: dicarboxylate/amino acid:cation symporter [Gammaproteobacteria bacterium]|nr:MAG: dicarboxylate/amino acid:cation symporter [Gammaproteobacteria bacterium]RLA15422.1 MAG: dicarboxylate/amino acid:cation symporter [Gammaproteobacteria bacterium]RLA17020.1 MAG: dicarboxylate/amino acid:cation symporter [Gammaproteobacteria bacterium]